MTNISKKDEPIGIKEKMQRNVCRLCGKHNNDYLHIFDNNKNHGTEISMKMFTCLRITVSISDVLPLIICHACYGKLNSFYDFFQMTQKSQMDLYSVYQGERRKRKLQAQSKSQIAIEKLIKRETVAEFEQSIFESPEKKHNTLVIDTSSAMTLEIKTENKKQCDNNDSKYHDKNEDEDDRNDENGNFSENRDDSSDENDATAQRENSKSLDPFSKLVAAYSWFCTICKDVVLDSVQEVRKHYVIEHDRQPIFNCIFCEKQYTCHNSFTKHFKANHAERSYVCDVCKKTFPLMSYLQKHKIVHSTERPHTCVTCGKSFKHISALRLHQKKHTDLGKQKFECDVCKKVYTNKYVLTNHLRTHSGEQTFMCHTCGKRFGSKSSLDCHLPSHLEERKFKCPTCDRAFKTPRCLKKHESIHSTIKPYQCDVCGKQFLKQRALREHSNIHTGEKPYKCEICGKSFRHTWSLTIHRRQHTGEKPYACDKCHRRFTNWPNYNKHMKRIHST